jgi:hypothetical protein
MPDYGRFPASPPPEFPPLPPQEEESLLCRLGQIPLSGLSWVGQSLSKPG